MVKSDSLKSEHNFIITPYCVLWSVLYVYVDRCLLALVTGVLEVVYLQPLALLKNVHQSWPLALNRSG